MIRAIFRSLDGTLSVAIRGKGTPRFFSLCAGAGIVLWGIKYNESNCCTANIRRRDLWRAARFRRKTGVHIKILRRRGIFFVIRRLVRHRMLCTLPVAAAIALLVLQGRIWEIRVEGAKVLNGEEIINYLSDKGITGGIRAGSIDFKALTLLIRQGFESIIWADVYRDGSSLVVNIKEDQRDYVRTEETGEYTDLCAAEDAVIASIVTRSGLPVVKAGDEVKAGDILVEAKQEILDDDGEVGEYYYKSADADILGFATREYEDWIEDESLSFSDAKELALAHLEEFLSELEEKVVQIRDKNVMIEKIGKKYHIYGQIEVCESIAESVAIGKEITDEPE